ncbi:MAG: flippase-like domain-containing protein [Candidatus Eisenbacteria bacterium]|nr:flippase-like domain-containing protein [Candidatus Latescibacterota bacterium]MBD3303063.1 flippase-like domain-containing protein [Candidatus Eisenbacteria bacterium]
MRRRWTVAIGLLVSGLFLYFAVRGARIDEMLEALARANYLYMIPCVAATLLAFWIRALRWRYLMASIRVIPQGLVFAATMIGFLANNVLPARLGELVRAHVVGRRAGISRSSALATILVERIFDLFTLLGLFAVVAAVSEFPMGLDRVALIVLGIGVATLVLLVIWHLHPQRFVHVLLRIVPRRFRHSIEDLGLRFGEGLGVFDRAGSLILVGFLSLAMWGLILAVVWLSILAVSIDIPQPEGAMVALVAIALVTMVPSAPGFIGTLQGGGTAALLVFGIPKEQGLAFTIVFHATQWFPVNAVGLYYLFREGLSFGQLSRIAEQEEPEDRAGGSRLLEREKPSDDA